jgi:membrane-bound lytic murein transglycosylase MltF
MTLDVLHLRIALGLFCVALFLIAPACKSSQPTTNENTAPPTGQEFVPTAESAPAEIDPTILDRLKTEKWTGDLDGLRERRYIRALVLYNKTNFFYDGPQPHGVTYEALKEFEKFLNTKLNTGDKPVYIVFLPVSSSEGIQRMADGRGDIAASNIPITPDLQQTMDFSVPLREQVKEIVVTGPSAPQITSLDDLAGKEVFVRRTSRYWTNLEKLNEQFTASGKPQIILREADVNLEDADILQMVSSGVVGITVMDDLVASLWVQIYDGLTAHQDLQVASEDKIGWAMQKNTPELKKLIDEFLAGHKVGTVFGNTLLKRYFKDTKWAKNNTMPDEMERFKGAIQFFKKYGAQYDFDWLMIAAQAYQESGIDQSRRSPAGAVGVMQIKPSTAEDKAIGVSNVDTDMEKNIEAGVKYLHYISDRYLNDGKFTKLNRGLFAFAAYNAGPGRVAQLRKQAQAEGLDPNKWFNNVELVAAKTIGAETVTYVSNIYRYYVAYKMVNEREQSKKSARDLKHGS